jgi:glycosyltransferase involved in cell wall biosynthesis
MRIDIVCPHSEIGKCGVYDHSMILCETLRKKGCEARLASTLSINSDNSDVSSVVLAYTPFLYGAWNPYPYLLLSRLRKAKIKTLLFIHEIFMPAYGSALANLIHRPFHFWQDRAVLQVTDQIAVTSTKRVYLLKKMGYKNVVRLPVFSNIPFSSTKDSNKKYVAGTFGSSHDDYMPEVLAGAMEISGLGRAIHIGSPDIIKSQYIEESGFLSPDAVSDTLRKLHYFVVCDKRGISFRKGSSAAALSHAIPVVANKTDWTDPEFIHGENVWFYDGTAQGLADALNTLDKHDVLRNRIANGGQQMYEKIMAPSVIADKICGILA